MKNSFFLILFSIFISLSFFAKSPVLQYGDSGWKIDSTRFDVRFPAMKEWAKAGVEGGIPSKNTVRIVKRIAPIDNLQLAIDNITKTPAVLLLAEGEYVISNMIRLRSGIILRGVNKNTVILSVKVHGQHPSLSTTPRQSALLLENVVNVGIENLTMKYTDVPFEPNDRDSFSAAWTMDVFHEREMRDTTLVVEHINMIKAKNCWVQDCNLLWSGTDPIRISASEHITCRRNLIDRCYNKADFGMGYYNITNSSYVLICNETIKRIRHFAIQNGSKYNVVINNDLEVDINFHNGDAGFNLIENNRVRIPTWHSWGPISVGDSRQHQPPGKGNVLLNNSFQDKSGKILYSEKDRVYFMTTDWTSKRVINSDIYLKKSLYPIH